MSAEAPSSSADAFGANGSNAGKKAVHVKWAGKTIALGTFPASEADEKCARAKALTRAWRSTMRPKPTREWVMVELERLGVRVVSGRLGRKAGEDGEDDSEPPTAAKKSGGVNNSNNMGTLGISPPMERSGSMGWGNDADLNSLMNRRNSMGLSLMNDGRRGSLGSLGQVVGLESVDPTLAHRQLGGGFDVGEAQRRASSLGLGSLAGGGGLGGMGMSVNPNQHYEMLKLHHMNLLNEIQETTLMMNLYQQQQLQQQQQQLQQQATVEGLIGSDPQLALMHQQNGMDPLFGAAKLGQRNSLGLGGNGNFGNQQMQLMQHQMMQQNVNQLNMQQQNSMGALQANITGNNIGGVAAAIVAAPASTGSPKKSKAVTAKKKKAQAVIKEEPKVADIEEEDDEDDDDEDDEEGDEDEELITGRKAL